MAEVTQGGGSPRVSVGIPVYNEAKFIRDALDALVAQDFEDFEIIISDNASTDATEEICREYAARDPRVRYYRNAEGVGAIANFNRVFELSRGEYFMWASGHDRWSRGYLSAAVRIMDEDPTVVLCSPRKSKLDPDGNVVRTIPNRIDTRTMAGDPVGRLNVFLWAGPHAYSIYGVIRSSALRRTGLFRPIYAPDIVLMAELSLLGCVAQMFDEDHYARYNRGEVESFESSLERYRRVFFPEKARPRRWYPLWRYAREFVRAAGKGELSRTQRMASIASVVVSLSRQRKHLLGELIHRGRGEN